MYIKRVSKMIIILNFRSWFLRLSAMSLSTHREDFKLHFVATGIDFTNCVRRPSLGMSQWSNTFWQTSIIHIISTMSRTNIITTWSSKNIDFCYCLIRVVVIWSVWGKGYISLFVYVIHIFTTISDCGHEFG